MTRERALVALGVRTIYGRGDEAVPGEGEPQFTEDVIAAKMGELALEAERAEYKALNPRQLRIGLILNGFTLDQVTATIDAIPDDRDRTVAKIEWEYAPKFERDHHLIAQVGAALGLTEAQIDTMWKQALTL